MCAAAVSSGHTSARMLGQRKGQRTQQSVFYEPASSSAESSQPASQGTVEEAPAETVCHYQESHPEWGDNSFLVMTRWRKSPAQRTICTSCLEYFRSSGANMAIVQRASWSSCAAFFHFAEPSRLEHKGQRKTRMEFWRLPPQTAAGCWALSLFPL